MTFIVTKRDGKTVRVKAETFHDDGTTLMLYSESGWLVAIFDRPRNCVPAEEERAG